MFGKKHVNKAKLEHKLYLARETPEPIFDISECELCEVPQGIYSLCKVFLKHELLLNNNRLLSLSGGGELKDLQLLKVLNISNNAFSCLPNDIHLLKNLQELYMSCNKLKKLCDSVCKLENLRILDASSNLLKELPDAFGELKQLRKLNIRQNKKLSHLPKSFCKLHNLHLFEVDAECFEYPPKEVIGGDLCGIMKFICEDVGVEYDPESSEKNDNRDTCKETEDSVDSVQQQKMKDFLEIERYNELMQRQEIELANASKTDRNKLLHMLAEQQYELDEKLVKIYQQKETERFMLIEQLQEEEHNASILIKQLLALNNEPLSQLLEQEQQETEKLLAVVRKYDDTFKKEEVLKAMQDILDQETVRFQRFHADRTLTSQSILEYEADAAGKLADVLKYQDEYKAKLVKDLKIDTALQKIAVAALLERGDARSWGLLQQIRLVESQLARLTTIEIDKKKLQMEQQLNDLCEQRMALSDLLINLLEQQKERQSQLISTVEYMEQNLDDINDFWLKQYQMLLDKLPCGLSQAQKNIDPLLAQALLSNGVIHCLPFLAKLTQSQCNLQNITDHDLLKAGINCGNERRKVLDAFCCYQKQNKLMLSNEPSAPPLSEEASAPPLEEIKTFTTLECVVCLDMECQTIFVPCGHLCCCRQCSTNITVCPLCRVDIEKFINTHSNI